MGLSDYKRRIKRAIPWPVFKAARQAMFAGEKHVCPVCASHVRTFLPSHLPDDKCPICLSSCRERLIWLYLSRHTNVLTAPLRVFHVAPERGIAEHLEQRGDLQYVASDIDPLTYLVPRKIMRVDLTEIPFADGSFDAIICNHVLEHIPDDKRAMSELFRVLAPGGFAVLLVPDPEKLDVTIEDIDATPEERTRRFGQADHVRLYGKDYVDKLAARGFEVEVWKAQEHEPDRVRDWRLNPAELVFVGRKPKRH